MSSESKGKAKKIRKKAAAGTIFSKEHYEMCVAHGINSGSSVKHKKDPTREMSKHDINVSELRELILSIFLESVQVPKYFEVKNPQFIRDIVVVHISDCSSLAAAGRVSTDPLCCVRNFKYTSPVREYPNHLLTVPMMEEDGDAAGGDVVASSFSADKHGLGPYVLTEAALRTWGFPVRLSAASSLLCGHVKGVVDSSSCPPERKKRKLSEGESEALPPLPDQTEEGMSGFLGGCVSLPCLAEAVAFLDSQKAQSECCLVPPPTCYSSSEVNAFPTSTAPLRFRQTSSVATKQYLTDGGSSLDLSVLGLDCEMCDTAVGPELTRLSVVDYNGMVVLDTMVKPYSPVVDYKEEFSGINAARLDGVSVRLEQVQAALLSLISSSTLLVGHSLENDLYALKLSHLNCVDTAVMYAHPIGFPHRHKLKYLAKEHLKINIQNCSSNASGVGHSSVEDARVTLQLAKLKAERGPLFGVKNPQDCPREPLVAKLPGDINSSFFFADKDAPTRRHRSWVGCGAQVSYSTDNDTAIDCAIQHLQHVSKRKNLLTDRNFTYIEVACNQYADMKKNSDISSRRDSDPSGDEGNRCYSYVERVKECLSTNSNRDVMMLVSCQSSVQEVVDLQNRKRACTKAMSASSWSTELEDLLERKKVVSSLSDVELLTVHAVENKLVPLLRN